MLVLHEGWPGDWEDIQWIHSPAVSYNPEETPYCCRERGLKCWRHSSAVNLQNQTSSHHLLHHRPVQSHLLSWITAVVPYRGATPTLLTTRPTLISYNSQ